MNVLVKCGPKEPPARQERAPVMVALPAVQLELPLEIPAMDPFVSERTALWYLEAAREMGNLGLISYWTEGPVDPHLLPDREARRATRRGHGVRELKGCPGRPPR